MARLNIEDPFWLEVIQLIAKTGDQDKAIGNAIRFFRHAQEKHKAGLAISEDEFKRLGFLEELIPLFAERTEDGIRAVGADKHFGWLLDKSHAGQLGGRISAQRPRDEKGRLLSKQNPSTAKQTQALGPNSQASSSSSLSINTNTTAVEKPTRRKKQLFKPESVEELRAAIDDETRKEWTELYPDAEFRKRESLKCWGYYREAGAKRPTTLAGWKRALGSWFARGWPGYAKGLPGPNQRPGPTPVRYAEFKPQEPTEPTRAGDPEAAANVRELVSQALGYKPRKEGA